MTKTKTKEVNKFNWKNSLLVGGIVYFSTIIISNILMAILNFIAKSSPNLKFIFSENINERVLAVGDLSKSSFYYGMAFSFALILFLIVSYFEEKKLLKNLKNIKYALLDGVIFASIFYLIEYLLERGLVGDVGFPFSYMSVNSVMPYTEILYFLIAYVGLLPLLIFFVNTYIKKS